MMFHTYLHVAKTSKYPYRAISTRPTRHAGLRQAHPCSGSSIYETMESCRLYRDSLLVGSNTGWRR